MYDSEDHYWWFVARRELALTLLSRAEGPVLDVGCGTGALLSTMSEDAVGVDSSPEALKFCLRRGLHKVALGDAQALPFLANEFDRVVTLDTLEHVPDDRAAISEIFRTLTPGGLLVLNVPAYRWLWGPHDVALHHHRRYTRAQMENLLKNAGFQVELLSYSVFFLFPVVVGVRFLDRVMRRNAKVRLPQVGRMLNALLIRLMRIEGWLLCRVTLPVGSSVVAVARK